MKRTPLKRNTPMKRGGKLNPMSLKRALEWPKYLALRAAYLINHPICQFDGCCSASFDIHHTALRGKNLCNVSTFLAVCRPHHNHIHNHPREARANGYLK